MRACVRVSSRLFSSPTINGLSYAILSSINLLKYYTHHRKPSSASSLNISIFYFFCKHFDISFIFHINSAMSKLSPMRNKYDFSKNLYFVLCLFVIVWRNIFLCSSIIFTIFSHVKFAFMSFPTETTAVAATTTTVQSFTYINSVQHLSCYKEWITWTGYTWIWLIDVFRIVDLA